MIVEPSITRTRDVINRWRRQGERIGLVPTMGYYHAGHYALMKRARELADRVIVSLFVNPTQFGPSEDFGAYPRDLDGDCRKARDNGVDLLFCPEIAEMYGPGNQTIVEVGVLSQGLCGAGRPGHFRGVTTVVTKLFNIIQPDCAVFGEKDFQQLAVIRRMVTDLRLPVQIIGHPTVREPDGLAMSSRNAYLSIAERAAAPVLYRALEAMHQAAGAAGGDCLVAELREIGRKMIAAEPLCAIEYLTIVDQETLQECDRLGPGSRTVGAMLVGGRVRLIDNLALTTPC
ncbi:MAG: pantoate--beta-alanine ligase [Desulfofustis sp.]|nr:pantoate--beta-alanine ligase [Desulfofustis sp.]